jgi:hypothetical protein
MDEGLWTAGVVVRSAGRYGFQIALVGCWSPRSWEFWPWVMVCTGRIGPFGEPHPTETANAKELSSIRLGVVQNTYLDGPSLRRDLGRERAL